MWRAITHVRVCTDLASLASRASGQLIRRLSACAPVAYSTTLSIPPMRALYLSRCALFSSLTATLN
jgi:hypothetical protein